MFKLSNKDSEYGAFNKGVIINDLKIIHCQKSHTEFINVAPFFFNFRLLSLSQNLNMIS
jgi:hypothetical protein